jgi:hypothetical protein
MFITCVQLVEETSLVNRQKSFAVSSVINERKPDFCDETYKIPPPFDHRKPDAALTSRKRVDAQEPS